MRAHVRHIGVVDHRGAVHAVTFGPGVNVITGKSSTGKSAMIEIFDYCFSSSDFTVPEGIITENSNMYFLVLRVKDTNLVLARRPGGNKTAFIREESDETLVNNSSGFGMSYFVDEYFMPIADYKKEVGRYFGLTMTDVDESSEEKSFRQNKKSPTPSIRSLMSFVLQHQGLIANKHAIFYRFDEKEKREQAIEHFKIFAGLVDQTYFLKSQELSTLRQQERLLEFRIPKEEEVNTKAAEDLDTVLKEYEAISGGTLGIGAISDVLRNPALALERMQKTRVDVLPLSDAHARQRTEYDSEKRQLIAELRKHQNELASVRHSIEFAMRYKKEAEAVRVPGDAELQVSRCPFCDNHHYGLEREANRLEDAIVWLNRELRRSPYLLESFEADEKQKMAEIERLKQGICDLDRKMDALDRQIADLKERQNQHELALNVKWRAERLLQDLLEQRGGRLVQELEEVRNQMSRIKSFLEVHYHVSTKLMKAEEYIRKEMAYIGSRFDFEESYQPINLHFSLSTFDLWHEWQGKRVFLRSMGSGANWLYCHLTLFLALHKYFCWLGDSCSIPSILFIDQPSQVYFPSAIDYGASFEPHELARLQGESRRRSADEDVCAVSNLYSELVRFCEATLAETGIEPQIIVTDHADNLALEGGRSFDSLVADRRWRTRGFIHPVPIRQTDSQLLDLTD